MGNHTHCAFSDESSWNEGRYRSIALVSGPRDSLKRLDGDLDARLAERSIGEIKWKDLKGGNKRDAAIAMLQVTSECASSGQCRADMLIWDTEDKRHKIQGRDDLQNLARMYYHLCRNVLQQKWPSDAVWRLLPDEHHAVDWETGEQCLDFASRRSALSPQASFEAILPRSTYRREFNVQKIVPVQSSEWRLTQMADLFAGMAVFSRNNHKDFSAWLKEQSGQHRLFDDMQCNASKASLGRFCVLKGFIDMCKQKGFSVSMASGGLETPAYKKESPINFWFYRPQNEHDRAPLKGKSGSR